MKYYNISMRMPRALMSWKYRTTFGLVKPFYRGLAYGVTNFQPKYMVLIHVQRDKPPDFQVTCDCPTLWLRDVYAR